MARFATLILFLGALLTGAGPALASEPPETVTLNPIVFNDINPCTNETHVVTLALTLRGHDFELTDPGRHHGTSTLAGTITTSSGFVGRITEIQVDNGAGLFGEEEGRGTLTFATNGMARNDSGDAFTVHLIFHITLVDDEAVAVVDRFRLECIG